MHYDWSAGHFWKVSHWPTRPGHNRNVIVCMSMPFGRYSRYSSPSRWCLTHVHHLVPIPWSPMQAIQIQMMPLTMIASWSLWAGLISSWVLQVPILFSTSAQISIYELNNKLAASPWVQPFLKVPVHFKSLDCEWRECRRKNVHRRNVHKRENLHICCLKKDLYFTKEAATSDHLTEAVWSEVFEISFYKDLL